MGRPSRCCGNRVIIGLSLLLLVSLQKFAWFRRVNAVLPKIADIVAEGTPLNWTAEAPLFDVPAKQTPPLNLTAEAPGPLSKSPIAIATMCIPANQSSCRIIPSKIFKPYADKYGYNLEILTERIDDGHSVHYSKVAFVQRLLDRYEVVFWLDGDSVIMNFDISVQDFLRKMGNKDLLLTADNSAIANTGQFLVRNSTWGRGFIERWYSMRYHDKGPWNDNRGILYVLGGCYGNDTLNELNACLATGCSTRDCLPKRDCSDPICKKTIKSSVTRATVAGVEAAIHGMGIPDEMKEHVKWIRQRDLNSYPKIYQKGDFRVHCAGFECGQKKEKLVGYVMQSQTDNGLV